MSRRIQSHSASKTAGDPKDHQQRPGRSLREISIVPIRTRIGSWRVFERRFQPIYREDGSLLWDRCELPAPANPQEWWTVLDCDGKLYLSAGFRFVNRFAYVRCAVAWNDLDLRQPDYRYD